MPRNTSGTYTLPVAAYVAGTTIRSADMNSNLSDLGATLTTSVATTGVSSMTGPLKLAAGSLAAPSLTLASDTTTGWYNSATGAWTYVYSGTALMTIGPTAVTIIDMTVTNLTVTGSFSVASARLVGEVIDYCGTSAPSLWLFPYGQAISRTTYSSLFGVIGTTFGAGDSSTTFNVPDYRGRVGIGRDDMGGVAAGRMTIPIIGSSLGATGGTDVYTLVTADLPAHTHANTLNDPGHSHTVTANGSRHGSAGADSGANFFNSNGDSPTPADRTPSMTSTTASTGVTITNASAGSGTAHNNTQPGLIVNKLIYAAV